MTVRYYCVSRSLSTWLLFFRGKLKQCTYIWPRQILALEELLHWIRKEGSAMYHTNQNCFLYKCNSFRRYKKLLVDIFISFLFTRQLVISRNHVNFLIYKRWKQFLLLHFQLIKQLPDNMIHDNSVSTTFTSKAMYVQVWVSGNHKMLSTIIGHITCNVSTFITKNNPVIPVHISLSLSLSCSLLILYFLCNS